MTNIYLKGKLATIFGKQFKIKIRSTLDAFKALDSQRENFLKTFLDFHKKGYNYQLVVDGEYIKSKEEMQEKRNIKNIYIVPIIVGSGPIPGMVAASITANAIAQVIIQTIIQVAINVAISLAVSYLVASMQKSAAPPKSFATTGGAVGAVSGSARSYVFANKGNLLSQGSSLPIGYGRMEIGTRTINATLKSYPTNMTFSQENYIGNQNFANIN
jgi:hypothetical protein